MMKSIQELLSLMICVGSSTEKDYCSGSNHKYSTMWIFNITRPPLLRSAIEITSYNNTVRFFGVDIFDSEF